MLGAPLRRRTAARRICLAWVGAGDPPAPPGDPPGGMAAMCDCEKTVPFRSMLLSIPSGGSPDGTGGSPVLPAVNTYWVETHDCRHISLREKRTETEMHPNYSIQ